MIKKKILLSSGSHKSHLIAVAGEINSTLKNFDVYFLCSFYPKKFLRTILNNFARNYKIINRFLDRNENLDENKVYSVPFAEFLSQFNACFISKSRKNLKEKIETFGMKYYSNFSVNILKKVQPHIFHYRSCYGLNALNYAKSKNIITICDHTIAHPRFLWSQIALGDKYQDPFKNLKLIKEDENSMNEIYELMNFELEKAENILVNSNFVKKTCVFYGIKPEKIKVIYLGCDPKFLSYKDKFKVRRKAKNEILYVGAWTKRKGAFEIANVLRSLRKEITLTIAGASYSDVKLLTPDIFDSNIKINIYSYLNRYDLSQVYSDHKLVILPSHAEGSARVGFEALASGCFLITTPNSGTIVEDNVNGLLFNAGNVKQLKFAIMKALEIPEKEIHEIMLNNFSLVRGYYNYKNYIEKLSNYYEFLESSY